MVLRDQLLGNRGVLHPPADLACDELRDGGVGRAVEEHVAEIALPDAEAGLRVQLLEKRLALLRRHLEGAARVRRVQEAGVAVPAALEHLGIACLDGALLLRGHGAVVQRRAQIRGALENGEVRGGLRHFLDCLHAGRAGADHRHPLAREAHRLMRPSVGVEGLALEALQSLDARQGRRRKRPDGGDQEARSMAVPIFQDHIPAPPFLLPVRRRHAAVELDVAAQVELVGDVVEVAQRLRLGREMLGPVPLVQQLLREGEAVGIALGVEARPRIPVPVPCAADARAGLEHPYPHPELAQAMELVHARHARSDDDGVVVRTCRRRRGRCLCFVRGGHALLFPHALPGGRARSASARHRAHRAGILRAGSKAIRGRSPSAKVAPRHRCI